MRPRLPIALTLVVTLAGAMYVMRAQAQSVAVEMPGDAPTDASPAPAEPPSTIIGGYGQIDLNSLKVGHEDFKTQADVHRLVVFLSHSLSPDIQIYSELEWEHALACDGCKGSAEIEQAYVQWKLLDDALALRVGLLLMPIGIINQAHEPPVFNGVERPEVDQFVIPSTWRELGLGIAGKLAEIYRYQLYLTTTLDPTRLGPSGLGGSSQLGSLGSADAFAVTGRFEVEPWLGIIAGASFFASDTGGNGEFFTNAGKPRDLSIPVLGYALDARAQRFGFEGRVLWTQFFLPESETLLGAVREDGSQFFPNTASTGAVPERTQGGYVELAYDTLHQLHVTHQLLAFARAETYDLQAAVPKGHKALPQLDVDVLTLGLTYKPISQLAFKSDVQLRDRRLGYDELQVDVGVGYMF